MMHFFAIFLSSLLMCSTVFASSVTSVSLGELSSALNERMLLMPDVAGYKALHHLPVEDLPREKVVIDTMTKNAQDAGLASDTVVPFVNALMNAGKAIQYRCLADWLATPQASAPVTDLANIRQKIQQTDTRIMTAISQRLMVGSFSEAEMAWLESQMTPPGLSAADKKNLLVALSHIQRAR
ncbi:chorismate mutase [Lelliottia amnigena]|uniref:chorismate mutase n=1 Tax=Lelliottia amnigena TaxID=61646 RepID=UPI001EF17E12|nr:chorismate mutase [Lelliottia amnigena]